jgi:hypothetical protein
VSAMKDVASCDKPRGAASKRRSGDVRMGKPTWSHIQVPEREPTQGTETSKYLEEKKSKEIPSVAASERGRGQTGGFRRGCGALSNRVKSVAERAWNGGPQRVRVPYAKHE